MKQTRGLGFTYQRGATWWICYSVRGQRHRESSESANHADAVRLLKKRIAEVKAGRPFGANIDKTTLGDIVEMLENEHKANGKSLNAIKAPVNHLIAYWGKDRPAVSITTDAVLKYTTKRQETGARNSTINRSLAALKRAFNLAQIAKRVADRPHIPMLEENNARQGFVTNAEFIRLRAALPADLRDPVEFLYRSGWRLNEMRTLEWRDIKDNTIRLRRENSKSKRGRVLPLRRELAEIIERAMARHLPKLPFVFHRDDGRPVGLFRKSWATACKAAGLGAILVHDLRRSAVRNMVDSGMSEKKAMMLTGHRTRSIFDRYDIVTEDDLADAVERVSDHLATQPRTVANVMPLKRTS